MCGALLRTLHTNDCDSSMLRNRLEEFTRVEIQGFFFLKKDTASFILKFCTASTLDGDDRRKSMPFTTRKVDRAEKNK